MPERLFPLLVGVLVLAVGVCVASAAVFGRQLTRHLRLRRRLRAAGEAEGETALTWRERVEPLRRGLERVGRWGARWMQPSRRVHDLVAQAGFQGAAAPWVYLGARLLLFAAGSATALLLQPAIPAMPIAFAAGLVLVAGAAASYVPPLGMRMARRHRSRAIRRYLPVAMDLLEIGVSAGASLDAVWNEVAEQIRPVCAPLADEMVLVALERRLGVPRPDALRDMARRTGVDDVRSLVGMLVQSQRYGTGVAEALRTFADTMRDTRMQRAEEAAEKLSVKLSVPMIVFIFPAVLLVAGGPGIMALLEAFARL